MPSNLLNLNLFFPLVPAWFQKNYRANAQLREAYILAGQLAFEKGAEEISRQDLAEGVQTVRGESLAVANGVGGNPVGFEAPAK